MYILRRVLGKLLARRGEHFVHLAQNVQAAAHAPAPARCSQNLLVNPLDLDVHLDGGNALIRAGNLEVHVAQEVLEALNIREHDDLVVLSLMRPIAMPATGFLIGTPASMSARELAQMLACEVEPFELSTSDTARIA